MEIDYCNKTVLQLLKRRIEASKRVAVCKWSAAVPNSAPERDKQILDDAAAYGASLGLEPEDARRVVKEMWSSARREQDALRAKLEAGEKA